MSRTFGIEFSAHAKRQGDKLPQDWAGTQNNLGLALSDQGERTTGEEGNRLLAEAVSAYRGALEVYTQKNFPYLWNIAKRNLDTVLETLDQRQKEK